jgi:hypothetical protein
MYEVREERGKLRTAAKEKEMACGRRARGKVQPRACAELDFSKRKLREVLWRGIWAAQEMARRKIRARSILPAREK